MPFWLDSIVVKAIYTALVTEELINLIPSSEY